ncbi:2Fe-2S iron-sulfur cluster-binding protein [Bosea thiooxidans]|nr:2Fe-2S iron-sulfur cluster-binding protein [Bosea sp. (in: a-proteobacteria)]
MDIIACRFLPSSTRREDHAWVEADQAFPGDGRRSACMMGVCFDCLAVVDGVSSAQTCLVPVRDGIRIERQQGCPDVMP